VEPNSNPIEVHPQLSNNGHPVDGALVGPGSPLGSKTRSSSQTRSEPRPESGTGTEIVEKQMYLRGGKKFGTEG
jgi:hypothetical protein